MKMKEIQFTEVGKAQLVDYEQRDILENEVLTRTHYTLISAGTERANLLGMPNTGPHFPKRLGYDGIGTVVRVGSAVEKVRPGDKVLIYHGTHAQYSVRPEKDVYPVRVNVKDEEAVFAIVGAMGLGGLRKTRLEFGESALIMGLGHLGLFAMQCARWMGACPLIAADLNPVRRDLALRLGADYVFDPADPDFAARVKEATGGKGVNAIVEVTGASQALMQALDCVARQGRIALNGCTRVSNCPIDFYRQVHAPGVSLIGAHNQVRPRQEGYPYHWTNEADCQAILSMMEKGKIEAAPLISIIASPEECGAIFNQLANDKDFPTGVMFDWTKIPCPTWE